MTLAVAILDGGGAPNCSSPQLIAVYVSLCVWRTACGEGAS
jgi:hypothetical protein